MQGEAERGLAFAEKAGFGLVIDFIAAQVALIRMLRGLTPAFGRLDHGQFNELQVERVLSGNPVLPIAACWYWIRKLQARYIAGDYAAAMDAAAQAQPLLWTASAHFEEAEYHFYGALTRAASCNAAPQAERLQHIDAVAAHYRQHRGVGEELPREFRESRGAGRRRAGAYRGPRARRRAPLRTGHPVGA